MKKLEVVILSAANFNEMRRLLLGEPLFLDEDESQFYGTVLRLKPYKKRELVRELGTETAKKARVVDDDNYINLVDPVKADIYSNGRYGLSLYRIGQTLREEKRPISDLTNSSLLTYEIDLEGKIRIPGINLDLDKGFLAALIRSILTDLDLLPETKLGKEIFKLLAEKEIHFYGLTRKNENKQQKYQLLCEYNDRGLIYYDKSPKLAKALI